jgi:CARDB
MGARIWLSAFVVVIALIGCTSPGSKFSYKDVKVSFGPSASPVQPVAGQATTISFTVRNTWDKPLTGVAWELHETGTSPAIATGTVDIVAFGSTSQTFIIASPTKGTHTYEVVVDPANSIAEQDETNNTSATLTVLVADQDISFGSTAPTITGPGGAALTSADTATQLTLTFTLLDAVNVAQTSPIAVDVPYGILLNGVAVTPVSASLASPVHVDPTGITPPVTQVVTVTLPATGSAGSFVYTITLSPADGDDSVTTNNTATVVVTIPAPG